jgi:hypothetical protein
VKLTSTQTQQSREALPNDVGGYDFTTVSPETYDIHVRKEGFAPSTQKGIAMTANNTARVDVKLNVGSVTESVPVAGSAAAFQTDRAEVASNVENTQLANLPMSTGRNYQTLFVTLPGFSGGDAEIFLKKSLTGSAAPSEPDEQPAGNQQEEGSHISA